MHESIRQSAGAALLRFAIARSLERQATERSITAATRPGSVEHANAMATLAAARLFESAMLWVGWRLHPTGLLSPGADFR